MTHPTVRIRATLLAVALVSAGAVSVTTGTTDSEAALDYEAYIAKAAQAGDPAPSRRPHHATSTRCPSVRVVAPAVTTRSPACTPTSTWARVPVSAPIVTAVRWATPSVLTTKT